MSRDPLDLEERLARAEKRLAYLEERFTRIISDLQERMLRVEGACPRMAKEEISL